MFLIKEYPIECLTLLQAIHQILGRAKNGEQLVISDPKRNKWIGASGEKEDPIDAAKLAQLARGGYIKEIHHPLGQRRRFRELITAYHDTNKSIVRIKNKIKASRSLPSKTYFRLENGILADFMGTTSFMSWNV